MPIEHTIEFYERVELLRLEKKGENFVPKLFKKVIDSCLKNCYPNLKQNQIKKYNDKVFFVLVDKKPAKDTHLLNPYGFFTIKVESENDINKVVIYDLCKSFQGEDNDIICRIMLRKFIEHLEKVSFQLNIKEANQENNLLIHEIVIYVSKNKNDEVKISCYNEVGFKSEDETIVMQNNNEEEEFEKYKLPLPPSKFLEKNTNTNQEKTANTIKESANSSNISNSVNKEPEVLTPEAISNGNNLGTITGQLEEIINNEKANMEKQVEEEKMNKSSNVNKSKEEETGITNEGNVTALSNGFSSVETNTEKEEKAKLEQSTKEQEEIDEKAKNSSFFGNIASTVTGFMTGSSSTSGSEEKEQINSGENSTTSTDSNTVSNTVTNTTDAISSAASNTAQAVGNVASNTMQSAQNLFTSKNNTSNETNNSDQTLQNSNNNNSNNIQSNQTNSFSQPNESSQNNSNENKGNNNISVSISENKNSEEEEQQQPQQQGGKKKNTKKKSKLTKKKKSKKNTKKKKTKINKKIMKGG